MRTAVVILLVVGATSSSLGLVRAYSVAPVKAQWSGWTDTIYPNNRVSEVLTINFDELDSTTGSYVELFAGGYGNGGDYNLSILTYPGGTQIASKPRGKYLRPQHWVRFDSINVIYPESIVKGKKLEFRFTRSGSDSIQYYYDEACGYNYGHMIAPYPPPSLTTGLAMRAYGRMNAVDSTYWGIVPELPWESDTLQDTWLKRAESAGVGLARVEIDWNEVQRVKPDSYDFGRWVDEQLKWVQDSAKCEVFAVLTRCPEWASTRYDSAAAAEELDRRPVRPRMA